MPEVTGVGGTEFQEGGVQYWSVTNDASQTSALAYIPEIVWNDSAADGSPSATGGGASTVFTKPAWQTGPGVPGDNARDVPDVSLSGSANHDGYMVYSSGTLQVVEGTSVPAPAFAGIAALLNQYLLSTNAQQAAGVGNMNPTLYALAQSVPSVFHDVTAGDNIVTVACSSRVRTCSNSAVGYSAGGGYDPATGLGSVDAYNLVTKWNGGAAITAAASTGITLLTNLSTAASTDVVFLIANRDGRKRPHARGDSGVFGRRHTAWFRAADGIVRNGHGNAGGERGPVAAGSSDHPGSLYTSLHGNGTRIGCRERHVAGLGLERDAGHYWCREWSLVRGNIRARHDSLRIRIAACAFYELGSQRAITDVDGGVAVTVNGVAAPLYYVSPGQLNIQIPYETAASTTATVTINNNGQVTSQSFLMAATAPGIFTDASRAPVPGASASRGQIVTLLLRGRAP